MASELFYTAGAMTHERSTFCCSFSSLVNLRDEFICYLPGTASDETEGSTAPSKESIVNRIGWLASEMTEADEKDGAVVGDDDAGKGDFLSHLLMMLMTYLHLPTLKS
eukprot:5496895-Ditylum_brightwellii.AAC.1